MGGGGSRTGVQDVTSPVWAPIHYITKVKVYEQQNITPKIQQRADQYSIYQYFTTSLKETSLKFQSQFSPTSHKQLSELNTAHYCTNLSGYLAAALFTRPRPMQYFTSSIANTHDRPRNCHRNKLVSNTTEELLKQVERKTKTYRLHKVLGRYDTVHQPKKQATVYKL